MYTWTVICYIILTPLCDNVEHWEFLQQELKTINSLFLWRNQPTAWRSRNGNRAQTKMMTYKMAIDLNVFSMVMESRTCAFWITLLLSQNIGVGSNKRTPRSLKSPRSQTTSAVVVARAWHIASAVEGARTHCFLLFRDIRESQEKSKIQKWIYDQ